MLRRWSPLTRMLGCCLAESGSAFSALALGCLASERCLVIKGEPGGVDGGDVGEPAGERGAEQRGRNADHRHEDGIAQSHRMEG
jgi:hypothetical protein